MRRANASELSSRVRVLATSCGSPDQALASEAAPGNYAGQWFEDVLRDPRQRCAAGPAARAQVPSSRALKPSRRGELVR
jgi:hypothetical protein